MGPILVVVLALPRSVPALVTHAYFILDAMGANVATFPSPVPAVSVVRGHVDELLLAHAQARRFGVEGTIARDGKRTIVVADLQQLRAIVQHLVSGDPEHAGSIATDAGMALRKPRSHQKPDLVVRAILSGVVRVVVRAVKGARAYEWQLSTDGKTWVSLPATVQASTTIKDLKPATLYYVRFRAILVKGEQNWSEGYPAITT